MLKDRRIAANAIAEKLFAAEAAINAAVSAVAQLTATMPMAAQDARIAACIGQEALQGAMDTCAQLIQARSTIIATHAALATARDNIGLGAVSFNDECPPRETKGTLRFATVEAVAA
jgi:hypothetical protein